jgi:general secretion pathway protein B
MPLEVEDDTENEERALSLREEKAGRKGVPGKGDVPGADAKKTAEPMLPGSAVTPPSLKLSAIVWYEEPTKRFAVINGVISYEGSVIEGAKVVEIYPDRVRFLQNDRHFEVPMFR